MIKGLFLSQHFAYSSESTHVKMPHCWKSHATAQIISTSFSSLPLNHSRRVVKYLHEVLVNSFALVRLAWFVFLASRDCCVALFQDVMGLSAVCDCDIS